MPNDDYSDAEAERSSPGEVNRSPLPRTIALQSIRRGLSNIAAALYQHKHVIGLAGAIIILIGAFLLWQADELVRYGMKLSPLTWLVALAGIAAGILVFRPHTGKFITITGFSLAAYALFTSWDQSYMYATSVSKEGWESWCNAGIITVLVGGCLLWYAGLLLSQFSWKRYLAKHLSWKAFLEFRCQCADQKLLLPGGAALCHLKLHHCEHLDAGAHCLSCYS